MSSKIQQLEGVYTREGTQLKKENFTLQIAERKNPTAKKPLTFLRSIYPFEYISSLYLTDDGLYWIEYKGEKYRVAITTNTALIVK
jgi:hypothetical protein